MVELQKVLLELLCEFDDICRRYKIIYYLSGGTNLGALRHRGFIPWDDDADIRMPRREFNKLDAIINSELKQNRAFVTKSRYPDYVNPIARYMNLNTTLLAKSRMVDGAPHGIFLDIIILDPMPRGEKELANWKRLHFVYCEILEYSHIAAARKTDWESIDIELYKKYEIREQNEGRKKILEELEKELFQIDENQADNYCMRFGTTWLGITPIKWYGKPREAEFENQKFYIAQCAERCAMANYGFNWKIIPDIGKRTTHSVFRFTDLDNGNCEREYLQFVEINDVKKVLKQYKLQRMDY
ncbi:MAG: LicD family protein, partial [Anaerovoracaceae bacterium]